MIFTLPKAADWRIEMKRKINKQKMIIFFCLIAMFVLMMTTSVFAEDIWSKAEEIMKDVYTKVLAISTAAGVVTASIALLLMNFSKSGKTVDESRAWLKRIAITWAILNSLGFIISYISPLLSGGKWNG